jgi:serine/threonine protein kinase
MQNPIQYRMGDAIPGTSYNFVGLLGQGGQGVVYEVRERTLRVHYAMKLLSHRLAESGQGVADLQKEAQVLAQHRSPFLVQVVAAGITQEALPRPYFVMQLLEGVSLADILKARTDRRMPIRTAINLTIQILEGLDAAHTHPTCSLVHRDIKPSNIWVHMVSPAESSAVILDLGIAKVLDGPSSHESRRQFVGTFEYAAPEQYNGAAVPQSDLYAVAGMLFEMITGRRVFHHENDRELVRAHLTEPAPRMSKFLTVPEELDAFVAMGLEKEVHRRPKSAFDCLRKLKAIREILDMREEEWLQHRKTEDTPLSEMYEATQVRKVKMDQLMREALGENPAREPKHYRAVPVMDPLAAEPDVMEPRAAGPALRPTVPQRAVPGNAEAEAARALTALPKRVAVSPEFRNAPTQTHRPLRRAERRRAEGDTKEVGITVPLSEVQGPKKAEVANILARVGTAPRSLSGTLPLQASPPISPAPAVADPQAQRVPLRSEVDFVPARPKERSVERPRFAQKVTRSGAARYASVKALFAVALGVVALVLAVWLVRSKRTAATGPEPTEVSGAASTAAAVVPVATPEPASIATAPVVAPLASLRESVATVQTAPTAPKVLPQRPALKPAPTKPRMPKYVDLLE